MQGLLNPVHGPGLQSESSRRLAKSPYRIMNSQTQHTYSYQRYQRMRRGAGADGAEAKDTLRVLIVTDEGGDYYSNANIDTGNYLAKKLYDLGHKVVIIGGVNTTLKQLPTELNDRVAYAERKDAVKLVNVGLDESLSEALSSEAMVFDVIVDMSNWSNRTTQIIQLPPAKDIKHLVYVSSTLLYGPGHYGVCDEETPLKPAGEYAEQKAQGEIAVRESGLPFTILRTGYMISPKSPKGLENWFFLRHHHDKAICIPGHGEFMVGVTHASDLSEGIASAMIEKKALGQVFNLQSSDTMSFNGLAMHTARIMEKDFSQENIAHYDERQFAYVFEKVRHQFPIQPIGHLMAASDKARDLLKWSPRFNVSSALEDSFKYHFNEMSINDELPKLDTELDELILENPHKQVQVQWVKPVINFARPLGSADEKFGVSGNQWEWE
eukprot:CAMPEP_0184491638 /NCGR_PEP_ID=MMETSP0113_2-20130426/20932_1 /TAXON_ID=91329 /ORGANISM="Norrisiella sphaerica, Strain BC52" /LENGTH=437 /DNA_ID=CAMNT_0026876081 /DNA_START=183 /DNA_END=1496 /DNA_ORIENTATION=+